MGAHGDHLMKGRHQCLDLLLAFRVARGLHRVGQRPTFCRFFHKGTADGQVDVLGKSLDGPVDFGEAGAALEQQVRANLRQGEQPFQRPADPEVLARMSGSRLRRSPARVKASRRVSAGSVARFMPPPPASVFSPSFPCLPFL